MKLGFPYLYRIYGIFFLFLSSASLFAQIGKNALINPVFESGEELNYTIRYGFIKGGEASLKVVSTHEDFKGKSSVHFLATGRTSGGLDIFYKVRNQYDSFIDPVTFLPYAYVENIRENSYTRSGTTYFDYIKREATNKKGFHPITEYTRDILSSYYFARSMDISGLKMGEKVTFYYFLEDGVYPLDIVYLGKEKVNTSLGHFNCLKYSPSIEPGRIFRKDSKMYLWITDDENRIPIKAKADILVGSIILELKDYKNILKPLVADKTQ
jgi:hypothetical protein